MRILRAAHLGMCFGVRDAIELAVRRSDTAPLTVLGDLVHNDAVLARLRSKGIASAKDPAVVKLVGELATIARLSPFYFARLFRSQTGMTPGGYLRHPRIEELAGASHVGACALEPFLEASQAAVLSGAA